jgi:hypothetical protein
MTTPTVVPAETITETTTEIPVITDTTTGTGTGADTATGSGSGEVPAAAATGQQNTPVIGAQSAPVSAGQYARTWAEQWRRNWTPPELWTHGRPSLRASWLWAVRGEHLPEDEQMRHASRAGAGALIPFRALFLYLDWIFERPSRVIAAAVLVLAVIQPFHPMF